MDLATRFSEVSESLTLGVHLLAVSKGHSASAIRNLADLGQIDFGESRLQEALPKLKSLKDLQEIRWHFIGHLQSNKVRSVIRHFDVIHSVDSLELAKRVSRIAIDENKCQEIMLQVKFRKDPSKGGFLPEELMEQWPELIELPSIKIIGLMTMAPIQLSLLDKKLLFRECRDFANKLQLKDCSMGMSNDWKQALEAGSTWLRLGSRLFGDANSKARPHKDVTKNH